MTLPPTRADLLRRLVDGPWDDDLHWLAAERLDDRDVPALRALFLADDTPDEVRSNAGCLLFGELLHPTHRDALDALWREAPDAARAWLIGVRDAAPPDVLAAVLRDPDHPWLERALGGLHFSDASEATTTVEALAALADHPSAAVRWRVADAVFWSEAHALRPTLLRLLDDPDDDVVVMAAEALGYQPGVSVVRALTASRARWEGRTSSLPLDDVREALSTCLREAADTPAEPQVRAWIGDLAGALPPASDEDATRPEDEATKHDNDAPKPINDAPKPNDNSPTPAPPPRPAPPTLADLDALLDDPDLPRAWSIDDATLPEVPPADRPRWVDRALRHPNDAVRRWMVQHLAAWGAWDALKVLAAPRGQQADSAARYALIRAPRDPALAALAADALRQRVGNLDETVDLLCAHADDPVPTLLTLLQVPRHELRIAAREQLAARGHPQPPAWDLTPGASVYELLTALAIAEHDPPDAIWSLDDAHVQRALVRGVVDGRWSPPG
jgi:hypothetical protein